MSGSVCCGEKDPRSHAQPAAAIFTVKTGLKWGVYNGEVTQQLWRFVDLASRCDRHGAVRHTQSVRRSRVDGCERAGWTRARRGLLVTVTLGTERRATSCNEAGFLE